MAGIAAARGVSDPALVEAVPIALDVVPPGLCIPFWRLSTCNLPTGGLMRGEIRSSFLSRVRNVRSHNGARLSRK